MLASARLGDRAGSRDNNFNLIRAVAAAGVLVSHAYPISLGPGAAEPLSAVLHGKTLGGVSVAIFFAVSGFFIAQSFDRRTSMQSFLLARGLRLFPALIVVLLLTVLFAGAFITTAAPAIYWPAAAAYVVHNLSLFFLQYPLPGVFEPNPFGSAINGSLWTLSYEVLCYAGVVVCGLAGLLRRRVLFALGFMAFLFSYPALVSLDPHPRFDSLMTLALPFAAGMTIYVWRGAMPLNILAMFALWIVAAAAWFTVAFYPAFILALSYTVFYLGYARIPVLGYYRALGDYSYGTYLYAFPLQQLVASQGVTDPVVNIAIALPATLLCAILSWHLVESHAMQLRKGSAGK